MDTQSMVLTFGSQLAVSIYGTEALYKEYSLKLTGYVDNGAVNEAFFSVQFTNPFPGEISRLKRMGEILYGLWLLDNPPIWDDGFKQDPHSQRPYDAGPFRYGRDFVHFLESQYEQRIRLEY